MIDLFERVFAIIVSNSSQICSMSETFTHALAPHLNSSSNFKDEIEENTTSACILLHASSFLIYLDNPSRKARRLILSCSNTVLVEPSFFLAPPFILSLP